MKTTIEKIRRHNAWRRGSEEIEMLSPKELGIALDALCDGYEELESENEEHSQKAIYWFVAFKELQGEVEHCLSENRHLADGEQCTLLGLRRAHEKVRSL